MNGSDRVASIVTVCLLAAFIALLVTLSSCILQQDQVKMPVTLLKQKSVHILQSKCIEARGDWDSQWDRCEFKK